MNNLPCNDEPNESKFMFADYEAHESFFIHHPEMNYLVYCETGRVQFFSSLFKNEVIDEGELVFLSRIGDYQGIALEKTHFIIHQFNNTICRPEECILHFLYSHRKRENCSIENHCRLKSNKSIHVFMTSISNYLIDKTGDTRLWNLKHKELIRLLCYYYQPIELQMFFHPMTDEQVPFKSLVLSHYQKVKTAKELANLCGYGIETFRRLFNEEFQIPIYRWLQKKKAEQVFFMLEIPHISLKEIIEELNFTSPQQFNKFCKMNLGDTPGKIQQKLRNTYQSKK